jgi:hypothetical protein
LRRESEYQRFSSTEHEGMGVVVVGVVVVGVVVVVVGVVVVVVGVVVVVVGVVVVVVGVVVVVRGAQVDVVVQGGLVVVGTWQTSSVGKAPTAVTAKINKKYLCIVYILLMHTLSVATVKILAELRLYLFSFAARGG